MRPAIARAREPRVPAKQDRLAVPVAAIGIVAIAIVEFRERQQTRTDADAAKLDRFNGLNFRRFFARFFPARRA
jgi:hypothetical protein